MKKFLSILLCMTVIFFFFSCSSREKTNDFDESVMKISNVISEFNGEYIFDDIGKTYAYTRINTNDTILWSEDSQVILRQISEKLGFSDLMNDIYNTRKSDGTLTKQNDKYKVSWSFSNPLLMLKFEMI